MHVLFVTQQWAPETGVPQRRGRWMVDALKRAGHSVSVVAPPPHYPSGRLISQDQRDQAYASFRVDDLEALYRSSFLPHSQSIKSRVMDQAVVAATSILTSLHSAGDRKPDVILCTAPPLPAAFTAYCVAKALGKPFVLDLRDSWPELTDYVVDSDGNSQGVKQLIRSLARPFFDLGGRAFGTILKHADGVLTTSAWHADFLKQRLECQISVITNLVLLDLDDSKREPDMRQDSSSLNILYTGTIGRAQGLENAIEAATLAQQQGTDIRLRFVGTGAHAERLTRKSADFPYVEFTGQVPREEIASHYEWADSLLVHLQDWEPLTRTIPSKLFEAIVSGKHVTVAGNGESAALIEQSGCGDAVPAMDPHALAQLWISLAQNRQDISPKSDGRLWLKDQLEATTPEQTFVDFIERTARV